MGGCVDDDAGVTPRIAGEHAARELERGVVGILKAHEHFIMRVPELEEAVSIVACADVHDYLKRFNALIEECDMLWTKPSELSFYAALGLPLVLAPPVGGHERANRDWLLGHGAALVQGEPERASEWLAAWLQDGSLARAAWSACRRLDRRGTERVAEIAGRGA